MTITQLQYVLALEKFGNFINAAEACHVSQPALSMQVKKLEDFLGVMIFDRNTSPVSVTTLGTKVLEQARTVMKEYNKINAIISEEMKEVQGTLKIGFIPTIAPYLVPAFLKRFTGLYPGVLLEIKELTTQDIIGALESGEIEMGVLATPLSLPNYEETHLFYEKLKLYVSPENELFGSESIKSKDLELNSLWLLEEGHCLRGQVENFCELRTQSSKSQGIDLQLGNLETIIRLVDKFKGITVLPQVAINDLTYAQKAQIRAFSGIEPKREMGILTDKNYPKKKLLNAVKEVLLSDVPASILANDSLGLLEVVE